MIKLLPIIILLVEISKKYTISDCGPTENVKKIIYKSFAGDTLLEYQYFFIILLIEISKSVLYPTMDLPRTLKI